MWLTSPSQEDLTGIPSEVVVTPAHSSPTSGPLRLITDLPIVRWLLCTSTLYFAPFVPELVGLAVLGRFCVPGALWGLRDL